MRLKCGAFTLSLLIHSLFIFILCLSLAGALAAPLDRSLPLSVDQVFERPIEPPAEEPLGELEEISNEFRPEQEQDRAEMDLVHTAKLQHEELPFEAMPTVFESELICVRIHEEKEIVPEVVETPPDPVEPESQEVIEESKQEDVSPNEAQGMAGIPDSAIAVSGNGKPPYPGLAIRKGWEGVVLLKVFVSSEGFCDRVLLVRSSGKSVLDKASIKAYESFRYSPAIVNGKAVGSSKEFHVVFQLTD